jgi:hypothetical protein
VDTGACMKERTAFCVCSVIFEVSKDPYQQWSHGISILPGRGWYPWESWPGLVNTWWEVAECFHAQRETLMSSTKKVITQF